MFQVVDYVIILSKAIMPILIFLSILCIILTLERWIFLQRRSSNMKVFMEGISKLIADNKRDEALDLCMREASPASKLISYTLQHLHESFNTIQYKLKSLALLEISKCERKINLLQNISHISPLFGFLGVILSFFIAYYSLQTSGMSYNSSSLFSNAVILSASSLAYSILLCILSYILYTFLFSKVKRIVYQIEFVYNEMLQLIEK